LSSSPSLADNLATTTFKRHRFPPDIISYAAWLYYRFNLSHRRSAGPFIEDLLAQRGMKKAQSHVIYRRDDFSSRNTNCCYTLLNFRIGVIAINILGLLVVIAAVLIAGLWIGVKIRRGWKAEKSHHLSLPKTSYMLILLTLVALNRQAQV
jgi:hypothetical protein